MRYLLAFGSNLVGRAGSPARTISSALYTLQVYGCQIIAVSRLYRSRAVGAGRQPDYLNCVAVVDAPGHAPAALLALVHRLERGAGRHQVRRRGARPLDVDIISARGQVLGWPTRTGRRPRLVLPHPLSHLRAFVLDPVVDVAPDWRHEAIGIRFADLARRLRRRRGETVVVAPVGWEARLAVTGCDQRPDHSASAPSSLRNI